MGASSSKTGRKMVKAKHPPKQWDHTSRSTDGNKNAPSSHHQPEIPAAVLVETVSPEQHAPPLAQQEEQQESASGGSISAPDSAPEDLEELKAWLRGLKPNFERYLPNFEQHGCVSMRKVRELTDEKFRSLIQTPNVMKGMHLKKLKIAINAAGGTISDEFSASSDDGIPLAKVVYEGGGEGEGSNIVEVTY
jgi:hypothetical protein